MPSETVSDGIFIVINKNQDKAEATKPQTVQIDIDSLGASAP
ncbi:hypothetical protein [Neisseria meningitidis]|nr:hypothetical protein [Neisseria meningitidis]